MKSSVRTTAVLLSAGAVALIAGCGGSTKTNTPVASAPASSAAATSAGPGPSDSASASPSAAPSKVIDKAAVSGAGQSDGVMTVGSLLPETGSLAFLGPPEVAGVKLAIKDINAAGGVLGKPAVYIDGDSGDTTTDIATQTVNRELAAKADLIVGAASSSVSLTVIDKITNSGAIEFSPANTSTKFTDYPDKGLYFRTAPSDLLQGGVVGNLIVGDGHSKVAIMALQDPYGTGLAAEAKKAIEAGNGTVTTTEIYDPTAAAYDDVVGKVKAVDPKLKDFNYSGESYDAVVVTALAMEVAKTDKPTDAAKVLADVTRKGTKCATYADCLKLVKAGTDIDYDGISGAIEFDDKGDPTVASYGVLVFGKDNKLDDTKRTFVKAGATK